MIRKILLIFLVIFSLILVSCGKSPKVENNKTTGEGKAQVQQVNGKEEGDSKIQVEKSENESTDIIGGELPETHQLTGDIDQGKGVREEISEEILKVVQKVGEKGDITICDNELKSKEDILICKREYIVRNADKLDATICKKLGNIEEEKGCTQFFTGPQNQ